MMHKWLTFGKFHSHSFFDRYRNLADGEEKAQNFPDCARLFNDCKAAEKYNSPHADLEQVADEEQFEEAETEQNEENSEDDNNMTTAPTTTTGSNDITKVELRTLSPLMNRFIMRRRN